MGEKAEPQNLKKARRTTSDESIVEIKKARASPGGECLHNPPVFDVDGSSDTVSVSNSSDNDVPVQGSTSSASTSTIPLQAPQQKV